ncbi:MAG: thioredoxin [Lachnospiraceae bacterium]|nr:thioredoxin [Lachnospiraceae bacterium]
MEKLFTASNFDSEVLQSDKTVLVDFYADWCGPCKMMAPLVAQLAEELAKEPGDSIVVGKLNVDENEALAERYSVMTIPTLMVFKQGQPVNKLIGIQSKEDVLRMIREA